MSNAFNETNNINVNKSFFSKAANWHIVAPGQRHLFHLVTPSPWPFMSSISLLYMATGGVLYFHYYKVGGFLSLLGLFLTLSVMYVWWRDVVREGTFLGYHNVKVRNGIRMGFILFVVSEVMFFASWFWAYFHSSLVPTPEIGSVWPPIGFDNSICVNPSTVPLLNTIILLSSGITVTWSHKALRINDLTSAFYSLVATIVLGLEFTLLQVWEYFTAQFHIYDSVYGSCFYMITGFHGFHVVCGTIFLIVCAVRLANGHFTKDRHLGYEFAIWYWHFVDIIWVFVYMFLYWWGSSYSFFGLF